MKINITNTDLKRAMAQPWDTKTCVVSQALRRQLRVDIQGCGTGGAYGLTENWRFDRSVADIMRAFDYAHTKEGARDYTAVERQLPFTVIVTKS